MRGLSMDELVKRLDYALTKQSIHKYEAGQMMPDSRSLILLANALEVTPDSLLRPIGPSIGETVFHSYVKLSGKPLASIKEMVRDQLECYLEIEELCGIESKMVNGIRNANIREDNDIGSIVANLKKEWRLGDNGIANEIETLENNCIKVIEIEAPTMIDALSAMVGESLRVIVLNSNFTAERKRFTVLRELGYLILEFDPESDSKERDHLCNIFAREMLISSDRFKSLIGERRHDISLQELIDLQCQYGISIDALMYKAKCCGIISEHRYAGFCMKKKALPQFRELVEGSRYRDEKSSRFERLVFCALATGIISISKASALLNQPIEQVYNDLNLI